MTAPRSLPCSTGSMEQWASFTGDGAYDRDDVYAEVAVRHPAAAVIPRPMQQGDGLHDFRNAREVTDQVA